MAFSTANTAGAEGTASSIQSVGEVAISLGISGNGRYIVWHSSDRIFLYDRGTGTYGYGALSYDPEPEPVDAMQPDISRSGRFVVFMSYERIVRTDRNPDSDIYVTDRKMGETILASPTPEELTGNDDNYQPAISGDGSKVSFVSNTRLTSDDRNGHPDIYVRDLEVGTTVRATRDETRGKSQGYSDLSGSGRYIALPARHNHIFVRDLVSGATEHISAVPHYTRAGNNTDPSISADGRYVAWAASGRIRAGDTNGTYDIYVYDRRTDTKRRASITESGDEPDGGSFEPAISANGKVVAYRSYATNVLNETADDLGHIYLTNWLTQETRLMDRSDGGEIGDDRAYRLGISGDASAAVFASIASNLVPDEEDHGDLYLRSPTGFLDQ